MSFSTILVLAKIYACSKGDAEGQGHREIHWEKLVCFKSIKAIQMKGNSAMVPEKENWIMMEKDILPQLGEQMTVEVGPDKIQPKV